MSVDASSQLAGLLASRASPKAIAWFSGVFDRLVAPLDTELFYTAFSGAGRRMGRKRIELTDIERTTLVGCAGVSPEGWGLDECARGALLLRAIVMLPESEHLGLLDDVHRRGEVRERQALLRVMACLPESQRFVEIAIEACRTSLQSVFDAIACDNPYPARHFPEHAFNQMVLKALFTDASVERIVGLPERVNEELERMSLGYASERRAAGRKVPDGIAYITTAHGAKLHRAKEQPEQ